MKKNFFIITAVVCGMSCTTTAYAQFKIGGKKINVTKVVLPEQILYSWQ